MTSRERVLTAMRRREPDRVPFDFGHGFAPAKLDELKERAGATDPNEYFQTDTRTVTIAPTQCPHDYSEYHKNSPTGTRVDEWGVGHLPTESSQTAHSHLEGFIYPMLRLQSREEALAYPLPDIEAAYRYENLPAQIRAYHERGLAVTASMECTIFEVAWYMRSMELLLTDCIDNPEFAETLLDRITEKRRVQAARFAEMGVDVIRLGDDIASQRGMLMSMLMWRTWLKQRLATVIAAARAVRPAVLIFYHSDGNAAAAIPDLIEIGVDILNPVQSECMDPAALKRQFGDRISFWGSIGTQSTLPFGTPDDVRREVKRRMETVGIGGGLLLAPTHMIEPDVSWENILALVEAIREYGRYE